MIKQTKADNKSTNKKKSVGQKTFEFADNEESFSFNGETDIGRFVLIGQAPFHIPINSISFSHFSLEISRIFQTIIKICK